jgi:hypothetical protein
MASGMTKLLAVNEISETVTPFHTGAVPSSSANPDIYSKAMLFLDRESKRIQSQGWPENTENSETFTADASGAITVLSTILRVRASNSSAHRTFVIRHDATAAEGSEQKLYDADNGTFEFGNLEVVFCDTVHLLSYENLPPLLQDVIVAKAKWEFQRRIGKNAQMDQALHQEYVQAEVALDRNQPDRQQPFNVQPMIPGAAPQKEDKKE